MKIYFDNSATTKPSERVIDIVANTMRNEYGNPSSAHEKGIEAENVLEIAKKKLATSLSCRKDELIFTSGGSESNNLALSGLAHRYRRNGNKIILSPFEHPSISAQISRLEEYGYEILFAPIDENGLIILDKLVEMIDEDVVLISIMYVNNEVGIVQPISEITKVVKSINRDVLVHTDAVQAFSKFILRVNDLGVDALSISAHKFHGPKGVGALYLKRGVNISPLISGSSQQGGLRAGTEDVYSIAGMGEAAQESYEDFAKVSEYLRDLKKHLLESLKDLEDVLFFVDNEVCASHIACFGFKNIRSEVLLHALEERGVYVSNGAACSSKKKKKTGTLKSLNIEDEKSETAIRVSFSKDNTKDEIDYFVTALKELIPILKRYVRK